MTGCFPTAQESCGLHDKVRVLRSYAFVYNHFIVAVGRPLVEPVHSLVKWREDKRWEYYMLWPTKIAVLTFDQAAFAGQHVWFDAWLLSD